MDFVVPIVLLLLPVAVITLWLVLWIWMFRDMQQNPDIPPRSPVVFTWPPQSKAAWVIAFFIFSLFTPLYYYLAIYRNSH
jgi:hypothetical protein